MKVHFVLHIFNRIEGFNFPFIVLPLLSPHRQVIGRYLAHYSRAGIAHYPVLSENFMYHENIAWESEGFGDSI